MDLLEKKSSEGSTLLS